ncbi:MAG: 3-phosphoshikimate 1-carboxyvinyltransferase [Bacteroidota bacterium]|jgi:3-phosphoshikimate 1-carboxyvinyltransferase
MMTDLQVISPGQRSGTITIPSSKSDVQRAILAAALARGKSVLYNVGTSDDERAMVRSVTLLGAEIHHLTQKELHIAGMKSFPSEVSLHTGESGLGLRLLSAVCAAHDGSYRLTGEGSLLQRPMHFFDEVLPQLGAKFESNHGFLPFSIHGPMKSSEIEVDGSSSSQYISGLLMALPLIQGNSKITVKNAASTPYIQMTLKTLADFGIEIRHEGFTTFLISGGQKYLSTEYTVEGDWSSASFWLVASALGCDIAVSGLSMSSYQADKRILDALISARCKVINTSDGITIDGNSREAFRFDATHCPDLFPALVTFGMFIKGNSVIKGTNRLMNKESNRAEVLVEEFTKLGGRLEVIGDELHIYGDGSLKGGEVFTHADHRIAMCLAIAGMFTEDLVTIQGANAVSKSYPDYWRHFDSLSVK